MDHFMALLSNGNLMPNPVNGSSVEIGSSNDALDRDSEEGLDKEDDEVEEEEDHEQQMDYHAEGEEFYDDEDGGHDDGDEQKRKRFKGQRLWRDKWEELHPWASVRIVNGEERIFCRVCEAHGQTTTRNAFTKGGSINFQQSALATHAKSSAHKSALLMQKAWTDEGQVSTYSSVTAKQMNQKKSERKNGTNKAKGKVQLAPSEHGTITNRLTNMGNTMGTVVTRDDVDGVKTNLRFMMRCQDARRINSCCAPTDPLMPVPMADGTIPENLPDSLAELVELPKENVDSLLIAYDLPSHGYQDAKIRRLKAHLGFR